MRGREKLFKKIRTKKVKCGKDRYRKLLVAELRDPVFDKRILEQAVRRELKLPKGTWLDVGNSNWRYDEEIVDVMTQTFEIGAQVMKPGERLGGLPEVKYSARILAQWSGHLDYENFKKTLQSDFVSGRDQFWKNSEGRWMAPTRSFNRIEKSILAQRYPAEFLEDLGQLSMDEALPRLVRAEREETKPPEKKGLFARKKR